jgi:hypothetical protein
MSSSLIDERVSLGQGSQSGLQAAQFAAIGHATSALAEMLLADHGRNAILNRNDPESSE